MTPQPELGLSTRAEMWLIGVSVAVIGFAVGLAWAADKLK